MNGELRYYGNCPHCQRRFYVTCELDELARGIECKCSGESCRQRFLVREKVSEVPARVPARATTSGRKIFTSPPMATEVKMV